VDDLLVIARQDCICHIEQSKTVLNNKYAIKDLGEAMSFLNIKIPRNLKAIEHCVCQDETPQLDQDRMSPLQPAS
jgi:hypothetical protein